MPGKPKEDKTLGPVEAPPMSREEIRKRQEEEVAKAFDEAKTEQDKRKVLHEQIAEGRARMMDLEALVQKGEETTEIVRELREREEQNAVLVKHLYEKVNEAVAQRQVGGRNAGLEHFDDEDVARDFGMYALRQTNKGRELIAGNEGLTKASEQFEQRALTGGAGSGDNYVIPQFEQTIVGTVKKFTGALTEPRVWPMTTDKLTFRNRGARAFGYRVDRATAIPESTPGNPNPFTLEAFKYGALAFLASELFEDSNTIPAVADIIVEDMGDVTAEMLERDVVIGDAGTQDAAYVAAEGYDPGNFYFDGFMLAAGFGTVTIAAGTTFDSVTFKDLISLISALDERFLGSPNVKFHLHRSIIHHFMGVQDTQGRFIWQPPTESAPGSLWGWNYQTWRSAPNTGQAAQNDSPFISFGDLKKAYAVGTRRAFRIDESRDFRFSTDEIAMRGTSRYAGSPFETDALKNLKTAA